MVVLLTGIPGRLSAGNVVPDLQQGVPTGN